MRTSVELPPGIPVAALIGRAGATVRAIGTATGARGYVDVARHKIFLAGARAAVHAASGAWQVAIEKALFGVEGVTWPGCEHLVMDGRGAMLHSSFAALLPDVVVDEREAGVPPTRAPSVAAASSCAVSPPPSPASSPRLMAVRAGAGSAAWETSARMPPVLSLVDGRLVGASMVAASAARDESLSPLLTAAPAPSTPSLLSAPPSVAGSDSGGHCAAGPGVSSSSGAGWCGGLGPANGSVAACCGEDVNPTPGIDYARAFVAAMRASEAPVSPVRGTLIKRLSPPLTPGGGAAGLVTDPGSPISVLLAHALWLARPGGRAQPTSPPLLSPPSTCSCPSLCCGEDDDTLSPSSPYPSAWSVLAAPSTPPALAALLSAATRAAVAGTGDSPLDAVKLYAHLGAGPSTRGAAGPPTLPRRAWHRAHLHAKTALGWSSAGRQERLHVTVADATAGGATTILTLVLGSPSASGAGALQSLRRGARSPLAAAVAVVAPAAANGWSAAHRVSGRLVVDVVSAVEPTAPGSGELLRLAAACDWHPPSTGQPGGGGADDYRSPGASPLRYPASGAAATAADAPEAASSSCPPSLGTLTFSPGYTLPQHLTVVDVARVSKERLLGEWEGVHYAATFSAIAGRSGMSTLLKVTPDMAVAGGGVANLGGTAVEGLAAVMGVLGAAAGGGGMGVGGPVWETSLEASSGR